MLSAKMGDIKLNSVYSTPELELMLARNIDE